MDFALERGEIHTLLGENGAGKSTLMNLIYGLYQPDAGEILIDGKPSVIDSPKTAIALGLGMVHQHFMLVPSLSVAENIALTSGRGEVSVSPCPSGGERPAAFRPLRVVHLTAHEGLAAFGWAAATGRDSQSTVCRCANLNP